ncbi:MAG: hypothetical protein HN411_04725 [Waddliaceae bacterium]|jgi:hypothetical protein|nr:hypothetical protein [Waddliaceae bacterium]MBT3579275.1 hypothetical protein [Waddliaceae bacterium]MBT4445591.1 hypothetical protein [Waddliaceae bacterium]MBT6928456.1 hypothetical protein [Waddliaceae bacterium]MBT7264102.1 hypothetical protein [Waddliaceae bacterium]
MQISPSTPFFSATGYVLQRASIIDRGPQEECYEALKTAIRNQEEQSFCESFKKVKEEERKYVLLELYDSLVDELESQAVDGKSGDSRFKEYYLFLMTMIYDRYPDLGKYMVAEEMVERPGDDDRPHIEHILTPEGVRFIVEYLRNKESIQVPCRVCDDDEAFEENLATFIKEDKSREMFIIRRHRRGQAKEYIHHMIPIYIENNTMGVRALISDSVAAEIYTEQPKRIILTKFPRAHIYDVAVERQTDSVSCSIFALRDVAKVSRFADIFKTLDILNPKGPTRLRRGGGKVKSCENLPPEMIKTTQHVSCWEEHAENKEYRKHVIVLKDGSSKNLLVQKRFYKYVRLFLEKIL